MLTLYEIVDDYRAALDWIDDHAEEIAAAGGEIPEELDHLLNWTESDLNKKVENVALVIQNQLANAAAVKSEADRLAKRAASMVRQAESLKRYLHGEMERAGVKRIDGDLVKVAVQKNGRPSISLVNPEVIPPQWSKTTVAFDGQAAYLALKAAGELDLRPGETRQTAGLSITCGTHLRVW